MATYQSKFDIGDQVLYFGVPGTVVHDHGGDEYTVRAASGEDSPWPIMADRLVLVKPTRWREGDLVQKPSQPDHTPVAISKVDAGGIGWIGGGLVGFFPPDQTKAVFVGRPGVQVVARASTFRRELEKQLDGFASAGHLSSGWRAALPPDEAVKVAIDHCKRVRERGITGSVQHLATSVMDVPGVTRFDVDHAAGEGRLEVAVECEDSAAFAATCLAIEDHRPVGAAIKASFRFSDGMRVNDVMFPLPSSEREHLERIVGTATRLGLRKLAKAPNFATVVGGLPGHHYASVVATGRVRAGDPVYTQAAAEAPARASGPCTECGGKGFVELFTSSTACSRGCGGVR